MKNKESVMTLFIKKFGYLPNSPEELFYDDKEYDKLLMKCIEDNFDYTIELYGTDPSYGTKPHDGVYID